MRLTLIKFLWFRMPHSLWIHFDRWVDAVHILHFRFFYSILCSRWPNFFCFFKLFFGLDKVVRSFNQEFFNLFLVFLVLLHSDRSLLLLCLKFLHLFSLILHQLLNFEISHFNFLFKLCLYFVDTLLIKAKVNYLIIFENFFFWVV